MNMKPLYQSLNYVFKDVGLLQQALTHKSYSKINYERLEFVGDSILNYVLTTNLYQLYPQLSEGKLSQIRATLVSQKCLSALACDLQLGTYLIMEQGEDQSGGRNRESILADALEAIFSAINFDSDILTVSNVIKHLYHNKLCNAEHLTVVDSKTILQEYLQHRRLNLPEYTVLAISGAQHDLLFKVSCNIPQLDICVHQTASTKKEASHLAATQALNLIYNNSNLNNS